MVVVVGEPEDAAMSLALNALQSDSGSTVGTASGTDDEGERSFCLSSSYDCNVIRRLLDGRVDQVCIYVYIVGN